MTTINYVKVECEGREKPVIWAYTDHEALQRVLSTYNDGIKEVRVHDATEDEAKRTVIGRRARIEDFVDDKRTTFNLGPILEVDD